MKYEQFHLNNFKAGYVTNATPEEAPDNSFGPGSFDVCLTTSGAVQKRKGYREAVTTTWDVSDTDGYDETLGIAQFHDPSIARALIRLSRKTATDDVRYEYNTANIPGTEAAIWSAGEDILVDGAEFDGEEKYATFASYAGRLYIACPGITGSGTDSPVKYIEDLEADGVISVTTSGSTRTLENPSGIELWFDRIWVFCDKSVERGSFLLYTNVDGDTFDLGASGTWLEVPGDGPITGIIRVGRRMLVFKPRETYILSGGEDPLNLLRIDQISSTVGCLGRRGMVEVDGLVYFLDEGGFYRTDGNTIDYISRDIDLDLGGLDRTLLDRVFAINSREERQVAWFIPVATGVGLGYGETPYGVEGYGDGSTNQRALVYDYNTGAWCAPYTNQDFVVGTSYANSVTGGSSGEEIVVVGTTPSAGAKLYQWAYGSSDDGNIVNGAVVTKAFGLGDPAQRKILRKLYLQIGEIEADVPIKVEAFPTYGTITATAASDSSTQKTTDGSETDPEYKQTRHTISSLGNHFRIRVSDYNDGTDMGGRWILAGIVGLFSRKGRRL